MLRMLSKTTATVAKIGRSDSDKRYSAIGEDDLSNWELIDASESDEEDLFYFDGDEVIIAGDGVIEPKPDVAEYELPCELSDSVAAAAADICTVLDLSPPLIYPTAVASLDRSFVSSNGCGDQDDGAYGDDFDDELVPWDVRKKIGRERMKKIDKKGGQQQQRHSKTKRLPCYYKVRPGSLC
ncbi:hypothetical protein M569_03491 [Genlisea aurea]|uniref:Uncharacterized protein n=1 Tax=Genlisea aurea TaxID=192259 RepID=S8E634_9LAMI|nr:hypothetical protein M569_03491 [Genlisea aurea]